METKPVPWLPTVAILGYIVMSTIGFLTVPWLMLGEVFPAEHRGTGGGLTMFCAYLIGFAVLKAYPGMTDVLQAHGTFMVYGVVSLLGTIFIILWLPETAGRTLADVEASFAGKKGPQERPLRDSKLLLQLPPTASSA